MKALHFGAGNIGRGFIGQILAHSGFHLTFSDINGNIVNAINARRKYDIEILSKQFFLDSIQGIQAIHINDPNIVSIIAESDIITTAVGVNNVNTLADVISKGIAHKIETKKNNYVNIIACENSFRCSSELKKCVLGLLSNKYHQYLEDNIGFVDAVVDRIISCNDKRKNDILFVRVEPFKELICDINQFRGNIPKVVDMQLSNNLDACVERKLFTLNTGHAITAYLGLLYGYSSVYSAILDKRIYDVVYGAMRESGNVLELRYNWDKIVHNRYIHSILSRFRNAHLMDDLIRVGRNPLRKLRKNDRLIKPILGTLEYQCSNINLAKGIAAALCYTNFYDSEAIRLSNLIETKGVNYILSEISRLDLRLPVVDLINKNFFFFKNKLCNNKDFI